MSAYQEPVLAAIRVTTSKVASIQANAPTVVSISGLDGWQSEDLTTFLDSASRRGEAAVAEGTRALYASDEHWSTSVL